MREVPLATNHQDAVEWREHARATHSLERERVIGSVLEQAHGPESIIGAFLAAPLRSAAYGSGMGTLYTAVYRPDRGSAEYRWPGVAWEQSFDGFHAGSRTIRLLESSAA